MSSISTAVKPGQGSVSKDRSRIVFTSAILASLGSLLFGFDTAVISGTTDSLRAAFQLSDNGLGFTVSSALLGTMAGSLLVGRPTDWWGRRKMLSALAALFLVSSIGCAGSWNWLALLFFRWLGGVAVGAASVACPVYITEIAPARQRGVLVAVSQLNIVIGVLLSYFSNYVVARMIGAEDSQIWRWMFGVMIVPSAVFLATAMFIPESPRWLVKQRRLADAAAVLTRLGRAEPAVELEEIEASLQEELSGPHQRLFQRKHLKPLLLALMIAAFNQLDGINAVTYYATDIFRMTGADRTSALMQAVLVGATNLAMTLVAMVLIDRIGRKALLLAGSVTFILSHSLAAWVFATHAQGWVVMLAMAGIVGSHAYSQGAVVWVCINEVLPNAIRASGSAVACSLLWLLDVAVSWSFPVVAGGAGAYAFGFFAVMMAVQFWLVLRYFPETKGVSLEELQRRLGVVD
jgi:SP family xylose:H+ symportor-like MFS transporter